MKQISYYPYLKQFFDDSVAYTSYFALVEIFATISLAIPN